MSEAKRKDVQRCCKQVRDGSTWPSYHQCTRKAVMWHDGKHYCKQHDPVAGAARDKARSEAMNAKWVASKERHRREAACVNACSGIPTAALEAGVVGELAKALEWYAEQSRLARLIHSEGDAGRHAIANDGGNLARETLARAKGVANGD